VCESVSGMKLTKWWRQIVPSMRGSHSKRVVSEWSHSTWHCDGARHEWWYSDLFCLL